jgi:two-component system sensor histidine kinase RpfC
MMGAVSVVQPGPMINKIRKGLKVSDYLEREQAFIRVAVGVLAFIYLIYVLVNDPDMPAARFAEFVYLATGFLLFSLFILVLTFIYPEKSVLRRVTGMFVDLGVTSYCLVLTGEAGVPLFTIYLWVTMGNGFRYGISYLMVSTAISIVGFSIVVLITPFWVQHTIFSVGLLIILVVLPPYMGVLLRKLSDAITMANEANQAKSKFLANMSHELRTPLNGVIGMTDLLSDTRLNEEQKDLTQSIQSSAQILLGLIEDILDISKIEAGKLVSQEEDFDLHLLVNNIVMMFEPQAKKKGLSIACHFSPETPFLLHGDQLHLRQILINLIGNAVKFTEEGRIEVRVRSVRCDVSLERIQFEVIDTGIGISEQAQSHVFESFSQANSDVNLTYGGSGLGTSIAKGIVESLGGKISVTSKEGEGSTFRFEIPFKIRDMASPDDQRPLQMSGTRVLLLAGDEMERDISMLLNGWNISYSVAKTSARAFSMLMKACDQNNSYKVVLVEWKHLDMRPDQFANVIRGESELKKISLVMSGASPRDDAEEKFLQSGYSSVLYAPLDAVLLFNALHAANAEFEPSEKVVSLAEHYRHRASSDPLNILVAEDNETNRKVIKGIIERVGHHVELVSDGEQALELLSRRGNSFDLVILDMRMPKINGVDVLKGFRFMDTSATIPVIMLTADATPEAKAACEEAGANIFLTKPIDARRLLDVVAGFSAQAAPESMETSSENTLVKHPGGELRSVQEAVVDEIVLENLLHLGAGTEFFKELIEGFTSDGARIMSELHESVELRDYLKLQDAIHALRGSAGELGASKLVRLCFQAERIKPYEMGSELPASLVASIKQSFDATETALVEFLNRQIEVEKAP